MGAALLAQPSQEERQTYSENAATLKRYLCYAAKGLLLYPRQAPSKKQRKAFHKEGRTPGFQTGAAAARDALPEPPRSDPAVAQRRAHHPPLLPPPPPPAALQPASAAEIQDSRRRGSLFPPLPLTHGHQFKWVRRKWACQRCLRRTLRDPPYLPFQCPGYNQVLSALAAEPRGHAIFVTATPDGILFVCMKCGCISEGVRVDKLGANCNHRPASDHTRSNLSRIRKGQHPSHKRGNAIVLDELVPVRDLL